MYWDQINPSYMSEESTHESDGEVVVHKHTPVFRSEGKGMIRLRFEASVIHVLLTLAGLNKLIKKLDERRTKQAGARKTPSFSPYPVSCVRHQKQSLVLMCHRGPLPDHTEEEVRPLLCHLLNCFTLPLQEHVQLDRPVT